MSVTPYIKSAKLGIESKQIAIDDARKELRKTIIYSEVFKINLAYF